jgi:hypothetical protein
MLGKVAVVGNEDGAHKVVADMFQGLNDIGFSIPAQGATYWNGEAMQTKDYNDLDEVPQGGHQGHDGGRAVRGAPSGRASR